MGTQADFTRRGDMLKAKKKTKWELKRERLMENETYRQIINRIEGDAEMFHRINLAILVKKTHPGRKYSSLLLR
jgi:hypothetical protein